MAQLRDEVKASIIDGLITAAKQAGFENPRITFIYGVGTENCNDVGDEGSDSFYQVYVTAQVNEGYTEHNPKFFAVSGTTYCIDRNNVVGTLIGDLGDLKVNTTDDAYDYGSYDHGPVIDALAEVIGYFYDDAQLPYHWHRVFETA